jgi:hypothetical protein
VVVGHQEGMERGETEKGTAWACALAALLRTIVPREKRDIQGFASPGAMHC